MRYNNEIKEFIIENFLFGDGKDFTDATNFFNDGIVDSTGVLEIICFVEETYNIDIPDDDVTLNNFSSVSTVNTYINNRLAQNHSNN